MKRWLLILLIALLPIQFSWAAVGAYCGDEHESSHEHALHAQTSEQGDASAYDEVSADSASASGFDLLDADCDSHCHGHSTPLSVAAISLVVDSADTRWIDEHVAQRFQLAQLRPERPQWQPLA